MSKKALTLNLFLPKSQRLCHQFWTLRKLNCIFCTPILCGRRSCLIEELQAKKSNFLETKGTDQKEQKEQMELINQGNVLAESPSIILLLMRWIPDQAFRVQALVRVIVLCSFKARYLTLALPLSTQENLGTGNQPVLQYMYIVIFVPCFFKIKSSVINASFSVIYNNDNAFYLSWVFQTFRFNTNYILL